ncbi:hypothetical protein SDC9_63640 [bioreactor metagenome]|jgi:hypothetical protein|uniref:Asparagine synthase n=2 Tax=root TaxID=1 RepID=A0A562J9A1_9FIRM|nr:MULTISPECIES: hypothetical protein [Sedimentibacter]MEA5095715.1 asparagine synthase [Sedimentibacter saalensis]TWH79772.1 hypothetical protein LY60_02091 [Sedimentibacter saalensis]
MHIKEGIIPTVLGTVVTATGIALKNSNNNLPESYTNGIIGFGLAHITLGSVEMISQNMQGKNVMDKMTKAVGIGRFS